MAVKDGGKDGDDFDMFGDKFEGMWFLLGIPGLSIGITLLVALVVYIRKLTRKDEDKEIDAAHLNLDLSSRPAHIGKSKGRFYGL